MCSSTQNPTWPRTVRGVARAKQLGTQNPVGSQSITLQQSGTVITMAKQKQKTKNI